MQDCGENCNCRKDVRKRNFSTFTEEGQGREKGPDVRIRKLYLNTTDSNCTPYTTNTGESHFTWRLAPDIIQRPMAYSIKEIFIPRWTFSPFGGAPAIFKLTTINASVPTTTNVVVADGYYTTGAALATAIQSALNAAATNGTVFTVTAPSTAANFNKYSIAETATLAGITWFLDFTGNPVLAGMLGLNAGQTGTFNCPGTLTPSYNVYTNSSIDVFGRTYNDVRVFSDILAPLSRSTGHVQGKEIPSLLLQFHDKIAQDSNNTFNDTQNAIHWFDGELSNTGMTPIDYPKDITDLDFRFSLDTREFNFQSPQVVGVGITIVIWFYWWNSPDLLQINYI